jgi:hypothetical protein
MARCGCGYNHAGERVEACKRHRGTPWRAKAEEKRRARKGGAKTKKRSVTKARRQASK